MDIRVQADAFDFGAEADRFARNRTDTGAIVTFCGIVRDADNNPLHAMEIEHYPGMTERALTEIAAEAHRRWELLDVLIIHRYGLMMPGEKIMMVATASAHRADAFAAADFLMDYLKSRAPFWKKEHRTMGTDWVQAKESDETALERW